ncbi:cyclase family protein [Arthrobacter mobilis]|uniref:Cyclase family protein n=1 Tax=Arthrobacter mobilis TaxID=2724944 RepID=A0A7X6HGG9_9MICC|nr:cyclase family protein [Arthrobacter mobilis]NKX55581.1 cyclase family protein [Arthrobacter mobilis]
MTDTASAAASETGVLAGLLAGLAEGRIEVIDLTTPLSAHTPALRLPTPFTNVIDLSLEEVAAYDERGPMWAHNNIHVGEHFGTHVDAPVHWISGRGGRDVSQLPVDRLVGPAAVIDLSPEAAANPDFLLEVGHIKAWEEKHGRLPKGAWLLYRTGWDQYGLDEALFLNADESGSHTPGVSSECARWLAEETEIAGFGVETVGIDAGTGFSLEPPFPAHYFLLGNDKYGVTSLKNLGKLPPAGSFVVVTPLPIIGGTASPARVLAFVEREHR